MVAMAAPSGNTGELGTDLAPISIEEAQLRFPHCEGVPRTGGYTGGGNVGWQFGRHHAFGDPSFEAPIENALRAQVLHAIDAEWHLHHGASVQELLRQERLWAEAQGSTIPLHQVHRWGSEKRCNELVRWVLVDF